MTQPQAPQRHPQQDIFDGYVLFRRLTIAFKRRLDEELPKIIEQFQKQADNIAENILPPAITKQLDQQVTESLKGKLPAKRASKKVKKVKKETTPITTGPTVETVEEERTNNGK